MDSHNQILPVAAMRSAEQALIDGGQGVSALMAMAGRGAAAWIWRLAAGRPVTVLCGPGNNGGDGYVIAADLQRRGARVRVMAPLPPATDAAREALQFCTAPMVERASGGVLVDCLFGSGLSRPLSAEHCALLAELAGSHATRVAVDMPSGIDSDSGQPLNDGLPDYHMTIALGAWKPAHALMPAMARMGHLRLVPIGVPAMADAAHLLQRPRLAPPLRDAHKYTRGMVLVVGGQMAGAAVLACHAALRAGAGAVRLATQESHPTLPDIVLKSQPLVQLLDDKRTDCVLLGPGLGRDGVAEAKLARISACSLPAVIDADGLMLLRPHHLQSRTAPLILTPHGGEMAQLLDSFAISKSGKIEQARALAQACGAVVMFKGPDTVIAAPDGRVTLASSTNGWLSVAGSGDVLAGIAASRLAATGDAYRAACEAAWLHGEAARLSFAPFTASDLAAAVPRAYAACL